MATYNRYDDDKVNYLLVITKKICGPFAEIYIFTSPAIKHSAQNSKCGQLDEFKALPLQIVLEYEAMREVGELLVVVLGGPLELGHQQHVVGGPAHPGNGSET